MDSIRNIGIFAHVDAGKTTLTEQLLLFTGAITKAGRVDDGAAHTDRLPIERERGISVRASTVAISHNGHTMRIVDTPGHVDFSREVEDALAAIDGAVLVVSAVEGVQAQTSAIYRMLSALRIPTIAFINKTDRAGADVRAVLMQLRALAPRPLLIESDDGILTEALTEFDDELLAQALAGQATHADIHRALARGCRSLNALPATCGSALKSEGIASVLTAIIDYLPPPAEHPRFSATAYHVERIGPERHVHLRVYGGQVVRGQEIDGHRIRWLRKVEPAGLVNVEHLDAGDIGVVIGADGFRSGDVLGERCRGRAAITAPVLRAQVVPPSDGQLLPLRDALTRMSDEQRELNFSFEPRTRKLYVEVMGEIQRQVIEQTLRSEYGIAARLTEPEVLLRETPLRKATGRLDMFFSPWFAHAIFDIEPLPRGSGVQFVSNMNTDLYIKYQRDIEETTHECLREGLYGWPVTDIRVTLVYGECTSITRPGSRFGPVTPLGIFDALSRAGTQLLEPMLRFEAHIDRHAASTLCFELTAVRGLVDPPRFSADTAIITGRAPAMTAMNFGARIQQLSRGRGLWRAEFDGYEPAPEGVCHAIPRTTPDPTNKEAYMAVINGVMG